MLKMQQRPKIFYSEGQKAMMIRRATRHRQLLGWEWWSTQ